MLNLHPHCLDCSKASVQTQMVKMLKKLVVWYWERMWFIHFQLVRDIDGRSHLPVAHSLARETIFFVCEFICFWERKGIRQRRGQKRERHREGLPKSVELDLWFGLKCQLLSPKWWWQALKLSPVHLQSSALWQACQKLCWWYSSWQCENSWLVDLLLVVSLDLDWKRLGEPWRWSEFGPLLSLLVLHHNLHLLLLHCLVPQKVSLGLSAFGSRRVLDRHSRCMLHNDRKNICKAPEPTCTLTYPLMIKCAPAVVRSTTKRKCFLKNSLIAQMQNHPLHAAWCWWIA